MASATATWQMDGDTAVWVTVEVESSFPDAVAEAIAGCWRLLRDTATDVLAISEAIATGTENDAEG